MIHKVLSVKQPCSHLICSGIKDIENRTWKLPEKYKGQRVLIHASSDKKFNYDVLNIKQYNAFLDKQTFKRDDFPFVDKLTRSAIIGSVEIVDCVINHPGIWAEKSNPISFDEYGYPLEYEKKIYNWVLANPILFDKPILNVKGKLGFWDYDLPEEYETILKL
jgi:hypothetical protein